MIASIQNIDALTHLRVRDAARARLELFPDFLILGPQRTGSTWLYHNLKKHPQIFLPRTKETYYFSTLDRPDHAHYAFDYLDDFLQTHMTERPRQRWKRHYDCLRKNHELYRPAMRGEATATNALLAPEVIAELVAIQPDLKAILMLRDPVERAWSHARKDLVRKFGRQPDEVAFEDYARFFRAAGQRGLAAYASQLRRWTAALKPGHVFVGDFEMIGRSPAALLTGLHRFLGIGSGARYFNRHLEERINPAAEGISATAAADLPAEAREYLTDLLREETAEYRDLRVLLRPDEADAGAVAAVRERFGIGIVDCPDAG